MNIDSDPLQLRTPEGKNIYQRICAIMGDVRIVPKESKKVNGQYTYVSHDAVARALHPELVKHGVAVIPTIIELVQDGNRTSVRMEIRFVNADNPRDFVSVIHYGYGIDSQDKGIGKAISYATKYAMLKTFCLESGSEDDNERIITVDYVPDLISEEQCEDIIKTLDHSDLLINRLCKWQGVKKLRDIPKKNFADVMNSIQKVKARELKNEEEKI